MNDLRVFVAQGNAQPIDLCSRHCGPYLAPKGELLQSVPQPIQLFRRACFEALGGYPLLSYAGADTYAEVTARMNGWEVRGYPDLVVNHHRYMGSAGGFLKGRFREGRMDFSLGYAPVFQALKCSRRWRQRPVLVGALVRMAGFLWSGIATRERLVSDEFIRFLRTGQARLRLTTHAAIHVELNNSGSKMPAYVQLARILRAGKTPRHPNQ